MRSSAADCVYQALPSRPPPKLWSYTPLGTTHKVPRPAAVCIGVGDGGQGARAPPQKKNGKQLFSGKNHVKLQEILLIFRANVIKIRVFW